MAGGPAGEMCADDEDRIIGETGQTALACQPRLGRVAIRRRRPLRMGDLARVMHEIAGDQRLLALRGDPRTDVTGGMAQGRNEIYFVADPMIGLNEIDEPGLPDRRHRVAEHRRHVLALVLAGPVCEFDAAHQVARVWEGRDPPTLDQHRVPADVIDVEVRANDRVDRLAGIACRRQIAEKARLQPVPGRDAPVLLVVAEAGVDDDPPARRFDDQRMNAHLESAPLVGEIGPQPPDRHDRFGRRLRQDEAASPGHLQFDDLRHRYLADPPFHHCLPPALAEENRQVGGSGVAFCQTPGMGRTRMAGLETILDSTEAERLATGFVFTEGPLWHPDGFYYFVDVRKSVLYRMMPSRTPEVVRTETGEGNGTTFDLQGRLVICEGGNRRVTRWSADGRSEVLMDRYEGN